MPVVYPTLPSEISALDSRVISAALSPLQVSVWYMLVYFKMPGVFMGNFCSAAAGPLCSKDKSTQRRVNLCY